MLLVASYRPDELHRRHPLRPLLAELERGPRARRIELVPLTRSELAEQLEDILGAAPDDGRVARMYARSEGNPLFTEELLAAGLDGRGELPPTLRDALMVRIEALPQDAQEVLRVISAGRSLDHALLAEASGLESGALREALREAAAGHVIAADDEGNYAFRHALLREVVHDDLLPGEHTELHLALARAFEHRMQAQGGNARLAAGIAHHYLSAGDQPAAFAAAVRAADKADEVHAHGEAATLYERALQLWSRVPDPEALAGIDHATLLCRAADAHHDKPRAEALYEAALSEIDETAEPYRAADLLERLANVRWGLGAAERSLATLERGLALLPADDDSAERAMLLGLRAKFLMLRGRHRSAVEAARAALDAAEAADEPAARSRALNAMGTSLMALGEVDRGAGKLREALELAVANGCLPEMRAAYINLADLLHQRGRSDEGRAVAHEGAERTTGTGGYSAWVSSVEAEIALDTGDWVFAERHLPDPGTGHRHDLRELRPAPRRARPRQGRLGAGTSAARPGRRRRRQHRRAAVPRRHGRPARRARAPRRRPRRRPRRDPPGARPHRDLHRRRRAPRPRRGRRRGRGGRRRPARLRPRRRRGAPARADGGRVPSRPHGRGRRGRRAGRGGVAAQRRGRARPRQRQAGPRAARGRGAGVGGGPAPLPRRADALARRRGARGRRPSATRRPPCSSARTRWPRRWAPAGCATRSRASPPARGSSSPGSDGVAAEPVAAAVAPEDPFGLTPRERQVLVLVAEGRTNREIGDSLFMAEKTASVHVSRILAKLDVRSRTEAAAVAHRLGLDGDAAAARPA